MNNVNVRVHISMKLSLKPHSKDWVASLTEKVRMQLQEMKRTFSEDDISEAITTMSHHQLSLCGVTFLLYLA